MNLATSQIEKHFQIHSLYKRSRKVLDLQEINSHALKEQMYRRKPTQSVETLDTRVDSRFLNASDARNQRLDREIFRFKKRYQNEDQELMDLVDELYGGDESAKEFVRVSQKLRKGLDWSKMKGRSCSWEKRPLYNSEDRFSNFQWGISPQKAKSIVVIKKKHHKHKHQNSNFSSQNMEEVDSIKLSKLSQSMKFDRAALRCLIEYDKKDKYSKLSRALPKIPLKQLDMDKVYQAKKLTSPCTTSHIYEFYHSENINSPSQMAIKLSKNNEFYFEDKNLRDYGDIGAQIRKEQMALNRLQRILSRKTDNPDTRGQICDQKYFKRRLLKQCK